MEVPTDPFDDVYDRIQDWARRRGIETRDIALPVHKAGEFNGLSASMNRSYSVEERTYYLVHALGSIVLWSLDRTGVQQMFDQLRSAKKFRGNDPDRLESAIERYRAFETRSSELAVWLLIELQGSGIVVSYTNFMRADLEALTQFHRSGKAPVWREFFACWNAAVAGGHHCVEPFKPRPVPEFVPLAIDNQEILQRQ